MITDLELLLECAKLEMVDDGQVEACVAGLGVTMTLLTTWRDFHESRYA